MSDPLDEMFKGAENSQKAFAELQQKNAELVGIVFNTDHGKKLLKQWVDSLLFKPSVCPDSSQFEAGIEEGKKEFVRQIMLGVHLASQSEENPSVFNILR